MPKEQKKIFYLFIILYFILIFYFVWKSRIGLMVDEIFQIQLIDMISGGKLIWKECWAVLQFPAILGVPFYRLYILIMGSKDGILIFMRLTSIIIQLVLSLYIYSTFKNTCGKIYALVASIIFFCYVADNYSFNYKQEMMWFILLNVVFLYRYLIYKRFKYLFFMAFSTSLGVIAYPTTILAAIVTCVFIIFYEKETRRKIVVLLVYMVTCGTIGLTFLYLTSFRIGIDEVMRSVPYFFIGSSFSGSLKMKVVHCIAKMLFFILFPMCFVGVIGLISKKKRFDWLNRVPFATVLIVLAFVGQTYIERSCVTWHIETYPYCVCAGYLLIIIYKDKDNLISRLFFSAFLIAFVSAMIASDQPNITSMYGGIFAVIGVIISMGLCNNANALIVREPFLREKTYLTGSLVLVAISVFLMLIYETESVMPDKYSTRTVFEGRYLSTSGTTQNLYIGEEYYENIEKVYKILDDIKLSTTDNLLIIDEDVPSICGYMYTEACAATYTAGGKNLEQLNEYYIVNPRMLPNIILINKKFADSKYDNYMYYIDRWSGGGNTSKIWCDQEYVVLLNRL